MNVEKSEVVKGFKVFDENWQCRGYQYTVGQTFTHEGAIDPCARGFHFCKEVADCFSYYSFNPANKIAEVRALGEVVGDGDKVVTNILEIVREVSWEEMLGLANVGSHNVGLRNSGDFNSGDRNSGNGNSGNGNSGNRNSGNGNSGDRNSGNGNSGNGNSGKWNSGNGNSGNGNSGDRNSGNGNSGEWNLSDHNSGCFNTETRPLHFFDKESDVTWEDWLRHAGRRTLAGFRYYPTSWVWDEDMSEVEKAANPHWEITRGYLKGNPQSYQEAFQEFWNLLDTDDKASVLTIPNFDAVKFQQITGVDVNG